MATSLVNICAIAYKDREFARMCAKTPAVFPLGSYALFAMRDGLTVTSSFVLKVGGWVGGWVVEKIEENEAVGI